jgi:hypothetical protein
MTDPGCGYSDCGGAATFSAICGCLDLSLWGQEGGFVWTCLESTCDCPEDTAGGGTSSTSDGAVKQAVTMLSLGLLGVVALTSSMS